MARREWQVALVWLNKIIDVYPDRASAHARRGICYLMTNQMQKADQISGKPLLKINHWPWPTVVLECSREGRTTQRSCGPFGSSH